MDCRILGSIVASMLFPLVPTHADTLTLRNNAELNGQVQYENDSFTISARFRAGNRTIAFNRKEVRSLELNSRDYNSGAPPPQLSNLDAQTSVIKDAARPDARASTGTSPQDASTKKNGAITPKSPLSSDQIDSATQDTVCLRDQTKLVGRVKRIQKGSLVVQIGDKMKEVDALKVTTVLIAPN